MFRFNATLFFLAKVLKIFNDGHFSKKYTGKRHVRNGGESMARPRKIVGISTGKISKAAKESRLRQEQELKIDRKTLERGAPEWLSDEAALEYNRVVDEAAKIDLLDNLDVAALAIYADQFDRYTKASLAIQKDGAVITGKSGRMMNPAVNVQVKAAELIAKMSTKLGLATTDRLKLIVPTKEEKKVNKFLKYV